jgi:hypothetical protein
MAQQGKQIKDCACKVYTNLSKKPVLLANGNGYEVDDSNMFIFFSGKALRPFGKLSCPNSELS